VIDVQLPEGFDESLWPMLGWLAGARSPNAIPLLTGLDAARPTDDDLKALCAAFATTSSAPMLHLRGHTPEAKLPPLLEAPRCQIGVADLAQVWSEFNTTGARVDLVAIGSPHASLGECRRFAELLRGQQCHPQTPTLVTVGRGVYAAAQSEGVIAALLRSGVRVIPDLCWCSITEPLFPAKAKALMTNSGKYAHYAAGLTGCDVRFGSLENCAEAAVAGGLPRRLPAWLTPDSKQAVSPQQA
jgi:predicted aconitase